MRELRIPAGTSGPFAGPSSAGEIVPTGQGRPPTRFRLGRHVFNWTQHLLAVVGVLTIAAFTAGATSIPEQIGGVMGRTAAAATKAQIDSQTSLQAAVTAAQQQANVDPQREVQTWQADLQTDVEALSTALQGAKDILVQKATADLQARNMLLDKDAQIQSGRVHQIMQIQEQLERGNITSAQLADIVKNFGDYLKMDTSRLREQTQDIRRRGQI